MNPELIEKLIRYIDDMAGCGFEDASELMLDIFNQHEIEITDGALERLIEKIKSKK